MHKHLDFSTKQAKPLIFLISCYMNLLTRKCTRMITDFAKMAKSSKVFLFFLVVVFFGTCLSDFANATSISYAAMQGNSIPCDRRSGNQLNCRPGNPVNAYSRGCSSEYHCGQGAAWRLSTWKKEKKYLFKLFSLAYLIKLVIFSLMSSTNLIIMDKTSVAFYMYSKTRHQSRAVRGIWCPLVIYNTNQSAISDLFN